MTKSFSWYNIVILCICIGIVSLQGIASAEGSPHAIAKQVQKPKSQPKNDHHSSATRDRGSKEHNSKQTKSKLHKLDAHVKALKELAYEAHSKGLYDIEKCLIAKANHAQCILTHERELQVLRATIEQMHANHAELLKQAQHYEREYSKAAIMANQLAQKIEDATRRMQAEFAGLRPALKASPCLKCIGPCGCQKTKNETRQAHPQSHSQ